MLSVMILDTYGETYVLEAESLWCAAVTYLCMHDLDSGAFFGRFGFDVKTLHVSCPEVRFLCAEVIICHG